MEGMTMLYLCDPYVNPGCSKENCCALTRDGLCYKTSKAECARLHDDGTPMVIGTVEALAARRYATQAQKTYDNKEVIA